MTNFFLLVVLFLFIEIFIRQLTSLFWRNFHYRTKIFGSVSSKLNDFFICDDSIRSQSVYFLNCMPIPHQRTAPSFFFCSFTFFDILDNILTCLNTCLWTPETKIHFARKISILKYYRNLSFVLLRRSCFSFLPCYQLN